METAVEGRNHMRKYERQVSNGIALLDRKKPNWRDSVDLATLDMANSCDCVLGQVYGHYQIGQNALGNTPERYGFFTLSSWLGLKREWHRQLS